MYLLSMSWRRQVQRPRSGAALVSILAVAACGLAGPRAALGNGAFPDGTAVIVRPDRPHQIVVTTNFGLVVSDDDGATWELTCEDQRDARNLYRYSPEPREPYRLFATGLRSNGFWGLAYTADEGCSWALAGATMDFLELQDYFLDLAVPGRLFAISTVLADGGLGYSLYVSKDSGHSFAPPLRAAPLGVLLASVESARSDPNVVYLLVRDLPGRYTIERSSDGGGSWEARPLAPELGEDFLIVSVDPADARKVLVRAISYDPSNNRIDRLIATSDGGDSWKVVLDLQPDAGATLTAFLRASTGSLLLAAIAYKTRLGMGFRSRDGGASWQPWDVGGLHIRGLGERGGTLYAVADDVVDKLALGRRSGEDDAWQPLMRYGDIKRLRPCAQARCYADCIRIADRFTLFPRTICGNAVDAAAEADGGAADAPGEAAPPLADGGPGGGGGGGCRCGLGGAGGGRPAGFPLWLALGAVALLSRRGRRRRRQRPLRRAPDRA
jgi:hypothetical protein